MKHPSSVLKGSLLILISALMFGSYGWFSRLLGSYDVFFQTWVRCLIVGIIFLIYGIIRKQFKPIAPKDLKWFAVVSGFSVFTIAPIVYAFRYLDLGTASFLFYGSLTIFTYIFGFLFFKEKLTSEKIGSLVLAVIGMLVIFTFNFSMALLIPGVLAILNGFASGGEITFTKKISQSYSTTQISMILFLLIAVTHFVISLIIGETQSISIITQSSLVLLSFALVAIIGMITVIKGFSLVDPSIGAIVGLTEIVFSALFGVLLLGDQLTTNTIVGGLLIIAAAALPDVKASLVKIHQKNK